MRYELADCERGVIKPMLPGKPRRVARVLRLVQEASEGVIRRANFKLDLFA